MRAPLALILVLLTACGTAPPRSVAPANPAAALETQPVASDQDQALSAEGPLHIMVKKKERLLQVYRGDKVVQSYRVALGFAPEGPKYREGDGRTPEGEYYISVKNPNSQYYLSLGISYPNAVDARRAWFNGRITEAQYQRILDANNRHATPPWNTALGGAIYIHGYGSYRDWTLGCIALNDWDVERLFQLIPVGTPVTIAP